MFDAESRDGQLWCVAECKVVGDLLPEEKEALADYISGQASDGWGEGFEQRAIDLEEGELYVSLWNSSNWTIQTEEEKFSPDSLTRLPDMCWPVLPGEGTLICIKKVRAATTPATGVPATGPRTATWRTITTSVGALHRHRNRRCSLAACAVGMYLVRIPSGMKNIRTRRREE